MKILLKGRLPEKQKTPDPSTKYVGQCGNCGAFVKFTYAEAGQTCLGQIMYPCPTPGCHSSITGHRGYMAFLFSFGD